MNNHGIDATYHSHTYRCGHARGTDREYVLAAYQNGFKVYGISDHIILPDRFQPGMRGDPGQFEDYLLSLSELKEEYKGRVDVKIGFEAEWYHARYRAYYESLIRNHTVDYLIQGQHCLIDSDDRFVWYASLDGKDRLYRYCEDLIEGMQSHLFAYVAHPDLFMSFYPCFDEDCEEITDRILKAAIDNHMPLEVNMGYSYRRSAFADGNFPLYPSAPFWDRVSKTDIPIIIGTDNHDPRCLETARYDYFLNFLKEHHLEKQRITRLDLDSIYHRN